MNYSSSKFTQLMKHIFISITLVFSLQMASAANKTITVSSLAELMPYLDDDNVNVVMTPGEYSISAKEVKNGTYGEVDFEDRAKLLLHFSGSNCTFDFTGVIINFDTKMFSAVPKKYRVHEFVVSGSNSVYKNLTMVDVGSVHDAPSRGALGVCMDGRDNRIEGFHQTVKGSTPYGYGDAFGKGKTSVIKHQKHSAFLVRGLRNHAKNCTIIHRSYGHAMFMQAASYPIIEGCYIEGEVRKTDEMLAETSGPAFDVDFQTVWGYKLPAGYMMSTGEAGIRAYDGGTTIIDGEVFKRGTDNPTVINCVVKYMRTGVTIAHATGKKYVEGCTAIGCENGFSLGHGEVVNCRADCSHGSAYTSTYATDKAYNADIMLIPAVNPYYNGTGNIAYIGGSAHTITLRGTSEAVEHGLAIKVGGDKGNIRLMNGNLPRQNNFTASDLRINNLTDYPVKLAKGTSGIEVMTNAEVTDKGKKNTVVTLSKE